MEENQVTESTNSESTTVESTETEKTVETKTYSEEEFNKAVQSERSKAKGELLKELGVNSVKEFKEKKSNYETAINERDDMEKRLEALGNKLICKTLNVKDDVSEDFIDLAKKRVTDSVTFEEAARTVAELYPGMINTQNVKQSETTGIEKHNKGTVEPQYSDEMLKRYPYLKSHKKI